VARQLCRHAVLRRRGGDYLGGECAAPAFSKQALRCVALRAARAGGGGRCGELSGAHRGGGGRVQVGISLLFVLYESAMPRTSVLGRLPGPVPVYRNAKQYPLARSVPGVLIFRVDSPIYFANVEHVKDKLRKYEDYHVGNSFSWLHHEEDGGGGGGTGELRYAGGGGGGGAAAAQCQSGEPALTTRCSHHEEVAAAAAAAGTPRRRRSDSGGGGGGGGTSAISDVEQTMAAGEAARRSQVIQLDQSEVVTGGCYHGGAGDGSRLGRGEKVREDTPAFAHTRAPHVWSQSWYTIYMITLNHFGTIDRVGGGLGMGVVDLRSSCGGALPDEAGDTHTHTLSLWRRSSTPGWCVPGSRKRATQIACASSSGIWRPSPRSTPRRSTLSRT
jgi:hypothetical protein